MSEAVRGRAARGEEGPVTLRGVAAPALDPEARYDVTTENGLFTAFTRTGPRQGGEHELWPGYTETHAHVSLPANWDDTVEDPRIVALQYLYHGVTHVVDMFGFPLVADAWAAGREASRPCSTPAAPSRTPAASRSRSTSTCSRFRRTATARAWRIRASASSTPSTRT